MMWTGGWIGVDLDGTLAKYQDDLTINQIGPPIPAMVARIKRWREEGAEVRIVTARVAASDLTNKDGTSDNPAFAEGQRALVEAWCVEHIGEALPVTAMKDFMMIALWDDRAVRVEHNTGRICSPSGCVGSGYPEAEPA